MAFLTLISILDIFGGPASLIYRKKLISRQCWKAVSLSLVLQYCFVGIYNQRGLGVVVQETRVFKNPTEIEDSYKSVTN